MNWSGLYSKWIRICSVLVLLSFNTAFTAGDEDIPERYQKVRQLDPAGYWPLDEGRGEKVRDLSENKNDGTIYAVPWQDGFLQFENNVYQWIEIDHHPDYSSSTFSMGGWVYSRKEYRGDSTYNENSSGVLIIGQPFTPAHHPVYNKDGALAWNIWGDDKPSFALNFDSPGGNSKGPSLIKVFSGGRGNVLGSDYDKVELATAKWQHVFYTYDASGTGRLYLNGRLVQSAEDVPYTPNDTPFAIGGGQWGTPNQGGTQSLDGSVRDMVLFDRALKQEEVKRLYKATRPENEPPSPTTSDGKASSTPDQLDKLIAQVRNKDLPEADRAKAALALADMGEKATDAVPILENILVNISKREGTHVPRIEDLLRNAVMRALLDIAPEQERVRNLLGKTLAKPLLYTLDGSKSYLDDIRPMVREGRYMDALEALRAHLENVPRLPTVAGDWGTVQTEKRLKRIRKHLPLSGEYLDAYLNRGLPFSDAHYHAYSVLDVYKGTTYIPVLEPVSWNEVKRQYEKNLKKIAEKEPSREKEWARLKILKIGPDGREREVYLGGPWLIFDISDAKVAG